MVLVYLVVDELNVLDVFIAMLLVLGNCKVEQLILRDGLTGQHRRAIAVSLGV